MDANKDTLDDYLRIARRLFSSMRDHGFHPSGAIPIDPNGELLGGAHRTACALALKIETVPVIRHEREAWAPAWGRDWFVENGMAEKDLVRLGQDWARLAL